MENSDKNNTDPIRSLRQLIDKVDKELDEQSAILNDSSEVEGGYPHILDPEFNTKISKKREFNQYKHDIDYSIPIDKVDDLCDSDFELTPNQIFVKHFLSSNTPYHGLLLYHGLGTGKTCSAISICEEHRKYMNQMQITNRILIVASPNVQDNFRLQLFDERKLTNSNGIWNLQNCIGNSILKEINPNQIHSISRSKLIKYINRLIDTNYKFIGYSGLSKWVRKLEDSQKTLQQKKDIIRQTFSNRMMVIDEVHNIRITSDNVGKKVTGMAIQKIVQYSEHMKLLLLSATPMFNQYKEIIFIINLLNINDGRSPIEEKQIFEKDGTFIEDDNGNQTGKDLFIRKSRGYISFIKGEHVHTFPHRVYPSQFDKDNSIFSLTSYPDTQLSDDFIFEPISHTDIYLSSLGNIQQQLYEETIYSMIQQLPPKQNSDTLFELPILDKSIQGLNMMYPSEDNKHTGKDGLLENMYATPNKLYCYREATLEQYGRIFEYEKIGNYSGKIKTILDCIMKSKGVILVYSQYIDGGCVPIALALEELGFKRYGIHSNILHNAKEKPGIDVNTMLPIDKDNIGSYTPAKYIIITGDSNLSPDNESDIRAATNDSNKYGNDVKVIIISRAASEGVDFKFIRQVHIMDPWYNHNRNEQIIGRAVRYCSHKLLPLEQRNVQIFMHGTKPFGNQQQYEPMDLYIYRIAEYKSKQIGYVTRVMKEGAIDCILNKSINQANVDTINQKINIELSIRKDGTYPIIPYDIGSKHLSNICDYQDCNYSCKPDIDMQNIEEDLTTYEPNHMLLNGIVRKIKDAFKEKYIYTKKELIGIVQHRTSYSKHQIDAALDFLIQNNDNEYISDMIGTIGKLINVGEYYMFQPIEYGNTMISYDDRISIPNFKYKWIQYKSTSNAPLKEKQNTTTTIMKHIEDTLNRTKTILKSEKGVKKDWYFYISHYMDSIPNIERECVLKYIVHHIFDFLSLKDKVKCIEHVYGKNERTLLEQHIYDYVKKYIYVHIQLNEDENEDAFLLLEDKTSKGKKNENDKPVIYMKTEDNTLQKSEILLKQMIHMLRTKNSALMKNKYKKDAYPNYVGFIKDNEFKMKDIRVNRAKGFKCKQSNTKDIKLIFSDLFGISDIFVEREKKSKKSLNRMEYCCVAEIVFRHYQEIQKNKKIWFLNPEVMYLNSKSEPWI